MYVESIVGVPKNGRQAITLTDKSGVARQVISTPEQIDEFLKERQKYKSFDKSYILPCGLGAVAAAGAGYLAKIKGAGPLAALGLFGSTFGMMLNAIHKTGKCMKADRRFIEQNS